MNAIEPHDGRGRVANNTPRTASIGCGHDCREESDTHSSLVNVASHHSAKDRSRDIVEKCGQDEDDGQQRQPASPIVGEQPRQMVRHVALLEMVRQHLEADEQKQQIGDNDPFMFKMTGKCFGPASGWEGAKERLVGHDDQQPCDGDFQRALVEQRYAQKHQPKKDELSRYRHG